MKIEVGGGVAALEGFLQVDAYPRSPAQPRVLADIRALPFRGLEHIYASHIFEHLQDTDVVPAMKSCRRALAPGGQLEIFVPDFIWALRNFLRAKTPPERWGSALKVIYGGQDTPGQFHKTGFTVYRMAACLEVAGFRTIDAKRRRRMHRACGWRNERGGTITHLPMEVWAVAVP